MSTKIQVRRGTTAQWAAANPVLASGEPGLDTTTGSFRIGDGSTVWISLPFVGLAALEALLDSRYASIVQGLVAPPSVVTATSNIPDAPAQTATGLSVGPFAAVLGRRYKITAQGHYASTVASDVIQFITMDGAASINFVQVVVAKAATPTLWHACFETHTLSTGNHTITVVGMAPVGVGTTTHYADGSLFSTMIIEDMGHP